MRKGGIGEVNKARRLTSSGERASLAAIFRSRRYHIRESFPNMVNEVVLPFRMVAPRAAAKHQSTAGSASCTPSPRPPGVSTCVQCQYYPNPTATAICNCRPLFATEYKYEGIKLRLNSRCLSSSDLLCNF